MQNSLSPANASSHITAYEVERNSHKKAFHDAVERNLREAGFGDAAALRSVFEASARSTVADESTARPRKARRQIFGADNHGVPLRRSRRITKQAPQQAVAASTQPSSSKQIGEGFCTWPGKAVTKKVKKKMKEQKTASKRKKSATPDPLHSLDQENSDMQSPTSQQRKKQRPLASEEVDLALFKDDFHDVQETQRGKHIEAAERPPPAGYRAPEQVWRPGQEWTDYSRPQYGDNLAPEYTGSFRRPWSPRAYAAGREHDGPAGNYGVRPALYQCPPDYNERRDSYYDGRDRQLQIRARQYEEERRFEDSRYDRRQAQPPPMYVRSEEPIRSNQYSQSSRGGSSPLPSSSTVLEEGIKGEVPMKRPLFLDKSGIPSGPMAALYHADIVKFSKDMDPNMGWEGQPTEAKDTLRRRLFDEYKIYGDSMAVSDKWLRKQVGTALSQFRFTLNQYIDRGCDKPHDLKDTYWDALKEKRQSKEAQDKSVKMASIARGRGSKNTTRKAVEESVLLKLASHLGREPHPTELKKAVDIEWSALQEEESERKFNREAASRSNAATEAAEALAKRLQSVEAFIRNWEPEFQKWKEMHMAIKDLDFAKFMKKSEGHEELLAILPQAENDEDTEPVAEEHGTGNSDDEVSNEELKSSSEEESESEDDEDESDSAKNSPEKPHPVSVVEPDEETLRKTQSKQASTGCGEQLLSKPNARNNVQTTSTVLVDRCAADAAIVHKKPQAKRPVQGVLLGEQDSVTPVEKEKEKQVASSKRRTLNNNSEAQPILLEDERSGEKAKTQDCPRKSTKSMRKAAKSLQVKVDCKGGKKKK